MNIYYSVIAQLVCVCASVFSVGPASSSRGFLKMYLFFNLAHLMERFPNPWIYLTYSSEEPTEGV